MFERFQKRVQAWWTKLQLLLVLRVDVDRGSMFLGEERVLISPTRMFAETRERVVDIGPAAQRFMYEAGKEAGYAYAKAVETVGKDVHDQENFSEMCAAFGRFTGWGDITIVSEDFENNVFTVEIGNSFFVNDADEKTGEYHAGNLAGAATYILETDMDAKEVACENQGADRCRFDLQPADTFGSLF